MNDYKYKNSKLFLFLLFIASLIMGIGYAAINTITLDITGTATASPEGVLYISDVTFSQGAYSENNNSSNTPNLLVLESNITLDDTETDSYVEYNITISNKSDNTYAYKGTKTDSNYYSNNDIVYLVSGITEYDEILPQGQVTLTIRFEYDENLAQVVDNVLKSSIGFEFVEVYTVKYNYSTVTSPTKAYNGENLVVNIGADYNYMNITIGGIKYKKYTYKNGVLTIPGKDVIGDIEITPVIDDGEITATLSPTMIDLSTADSAQIVLKVTNTYSSEMDFDILLSNNKYKITDVNGNSISTYIISANSNESYTFNIKTIDGSAFDKETENIYFTLDYNIATVNTNEVTITVPLIEDIVPPTINAIELTMAAATGDITVNWSGQDNSDGEILYTINLYKASDNSLVSTHSYSSSSKEMLTYTISATEAEMYYYVKIYGTDETGNSGASYLDEATTTSTYCRSSEQIARYSVTYNFTGATSSNTDKYIIAGETYEATISASDGYWVTSVTVKMGDTTLEEDVGYTYISSVLSIPNITGNLTITAQAVQACLIEGTEITLADGRKKKIENIDYTDLLLVWDYEHGMFTYEYPIWIEKGGKSKVYQKTTFSDGSTLKTVGYHGIFSVDEMRFVSVDNKSEFDIGTKVLKVNNNSGQYQFEEVTVTDIEIITEEVSFYQIVTTTYYNVISDDYMTTDGNVILVNLYGFNEDYTWKTNRKEVIADENNLFEYEMLESIMPYYMFAGLRAAEVKYISNLGYFSLEQVPQLMKQLEACNNKRLLPVPVKDDGCRYWMVTTSEDIVTESNKEKYMSKENSYHTLPNPKKAEKFLYWYNTANGEKYLAGNKVKIIYGTHFVAIYE